MHDRIRNVCLIRLLLNFHHLLALSVELEILFGLVSHSDCILCLTAQVPPVESLNTVVRIRQRKHCFLFNQVQVILQWKWFTLQSVPGLSMLQTIRCCSEPSDLSGNCTGLPSLLQDTRIAKSSTPGTQRPHTNQITQFYVLNEAIHLLPFEGFMTKA